MFQHAAGIPALLRKVIPPAAKVLRPSRGLPPPGTARRRLNERRAPGSDWPGWLEPLAELRICPCYSTMNSESRRTMDEGRRIYSRSRMRAPGGLLYELSSSLRAATSGLSLGREKCRPRPSELRSTTTAGVVVVVVLAGLDFRAGASPLKTSNKRPPCTAPEVPTSATTEKGIKTSVFLNIGEVWESFGSGARDRT